VQNLFNVPDGDGWIKDYSCALERKQFLRHGRMYLTRNHLCFYSSVLHTKEVTAWKDVLTIEKDAHAFINPAVVVTSRTSEGQTHQLFFCSFMSRKATYEVMIRLWKGEEVEMTHTDETEMTEMNDGSDEDVLTAQPTPRLNSEPTARTDSDTPRIAGITPRNQSDTPQTGRAGVRLDLAASSITLPSMARNTPTTPRSMNSKRPLLSAGNNNNHITSNVVFNSQSTPDIMATTIALSDSHKNHKNVVSCDSLLDDDVSRYLLSGWRPYERWLTQYRGSQL